MNWVLVRLWRGQASNHIYLADCGKLTPNLHYSIQDLTSLGRSNEALFKPSSIRIHQTNSCVLFLRNALLTTAKNSASGPASIPQAWVGRICL